MRRRQYCAAGVSIALPTIAGCLFESGDDDDVVADTIVDEDGATMDFSAEEDDTIVLEFNFIGEPGTARITVTYDRGSEVLLETVITSSFEGEVTTPHEGLHNVQADDVSGLDQRAGMSVRIPEE